MEYGYFLARPFLGARQVAAPLRARRWVVKILML